MSPQRISFKPLTPEEKSSLVNRLRSVRGHVEAIIAMIDGDAYCIDVLKQISAVRSALDKVGGIELRHHFLNCFSEAVRSGKGARAANEVLEALRFHKELFRE